MHNPVLVVGGGMAGYALILALETLGVPADLVEASPGRASAHASGGILNPRPGRFLDSPLHAESFEESLSFLKTTQAILSAHLVGQENQQDSRSIFFHPKPIFRPFLDERHRKKTLMRWDSGLPPQLTFHPSSPDYLSAKYCYGGIMVQGGGCFSWPEALSSLYKKLKKESRFLEYDVKPSDLQLGEAGVRFQSKTYSLVILATGAWSIQRFHADLIPLGGQSVEVRAGAEEDHLPILLAGKYLIPTHQHTWILGATQEKEPQEWGPKKDNSQELLMIPQNFLGKSAGKIMHHRWGIRPGTKNRKPFFRSWHGTRVAQFNGLGSKGGYQVGLLAPSIAALVKKRLQSGFHPGDFF